MPLHLASTVDEVIISITSESLIATLPDETLPCRYHVDCAPAS